MHWVVDGLKNNKALGKDGVVNRQQNFQRQKGYNLRKKSTEINRVVQRSEKISDDGETGITYPIFKKGNPAETNNYRGSNLLIRHRL